jgi:CRISPR-associated protein Cmr3
LAKTVRGPILVELGEDGQIQRYFPAPADALLVEEKDSQKIMRHALMPLTLPDGASTDLAGLALVGTEKHIKAKPFGSAPRYWSWDSLQAWLEHAEAGIVDPKALGLPDMVREHRTHVSINPKLQASQEGALFQTSGLEFVRVKQNGEQRLKEAIPLALAVETDAVLAAGVDFLGGERRVVCWQSAQEILPPCPERVRKTIELQKCCRLVLATPASFTGGHLPGGYLQGLGAAARAVAVPRYQTISGWDYARPRGGEPKPTRRLAPAGSVYFLDLKGVGDISKFMDGVWLQAVSDDEQARRDGFGLALLGTWDGELRRVEVQS